MWFALWGSGALKVGIAVAVTRKRGCINVNTVELTECKVLRAHALQTCINMLWVNIFPCKTHAWCDTYVFVTQFYQYYKLKVILKLKYCHVYHLEPIKATHWFCVMWSYNNWFTNIACIVAQTLFMSLLVHWHILRVGLGMHGCMLACMSGNDVRVNINTELHETTINNYNC